MADSDSVLSILIKLGVLGQADAKAAKDLLAETGAAAKEAGKGADYLNPAMAQAGKSLNTAEDAAAGSAKQFRLLALGAREAGAQIPGLSILLRGLFNPATAGFAIGLAAIEGYFGHLQKVQEKQLEWTKELQKTNDALHDITSSGKSAGEQLIEINHALAEGQIKAHGYAHAIESATSMWKNYQEQVKDTADAQKEADTDAAANIKSRIDLMEKEGIISKERAERLRAQAAYEAEVAKVNDERNAKEAQYKNLGDQVNDAMRKRKELGTDKDAQTKLQADSQNLAHNESILTKMPAILAQMRTQMADADRRGDFPTAHALNDSINRDQALLDKAKADNPELKKRVAQDKDAIAAMGLLDDKVKDLTQQMNLLNVSIVDFNKSSAAHLVAAAGQRDIATIDAVGGLGQTNQILSAGEAALEAYGHGQKLSNAQNQAIANLRTLVGSLGGNAEQFVHLTEALIQHHKSTYDIVAQLQRDVANLRTLTTRPIR